MRGATVTVWSGIHVGQDQISIHTPHAGSDTYPNHVQFDDRAFQSTLPMRGATCIAPNMIRAPLGFQSTLPMRGATGFPPVVAVLFIISIHTPQMRGAEQHRQPAGADGINISIHTPHAGSDRGLRSRQGRPLRFQSTLPMRGATITFPPVVAVLFIISIHTPHAGSDAARKLAPFSDSNFNPHSPCGERRLSWSTAYQPTEFQSTLPMRGATMPALIVRPFQAISIHTPHAGSDPIAKARVRS